MRPPVRGSRPQQPRGAADPSATRPAFMNNSGSEPNSPGARPVSREAVDATPDQEVRPELPGEAEQLVDVALAVADMDASSGVAQRRGGLAHVVQPPHALLALDRDARRIDLS